VNANHPAAFGTRPSVLLACQESPDTEILDIFEILNHAHIVLGSISSVQMFDSVAREFFAFKTKLCFSVLKHFAVFDSASGASNGFIGIVNSAAMASFLGSQIGHANSAIHSAGCNKRNLIQTRHK